MTTATAASNGNQTKAAAAAGPSKWDTEQVSFIPFGTNEKVNLTARMVYEYLARPTKSGKKPTFEDVVRFLMLCKSRQLNPFVGDAYLVGYDSQNGPEFNLITAHQAFLKRAECHKEFDGMESGVLVADDEGNVHELVGDFFPDGMSILGAWATVYFKNRKIPMRKRLKLSTFNKGFSRWKVDPAGMIVKCAEADALRSSFPTELGGMYLAGEIQDVEISESTQTHNIAPVSRIDDLTTRINMGVRQAEMVPANATQDDSDGYEATTAEETPTGNTPVSQLTDEEKAAIEAQEADPLHDMRASIVAELARTGRTWKSNYQGVCGKLPLDKVSEVQLRYALDDLKQRPDKAS